MLKKATQNVELKQFKKELEENDRLAKEEMKNLTYEQQLADFANFVKTKNIKLKEKPNGKK